MLVVVLRGLFDQGGRMGGELDDDFADLLDQPGLVQHVNVTTLLVAANNRSNILDLVITSETSHLVSTASVVTSHHLSDHSLVICDIRLNRIKIVAPNRSARNIKAIDKVDFARRLRESSLFIDPTITVNAFTVQMERVTTELLDAVAPLRAVHHKFTPARQLSPEAVAAKRNRRVKERQWKYSKLETDRLSYRQACSNAYSLSIPQGTKITSERSRTVPWTRK